MTDQKLPWKRSTLWLPSTSQVFYTIVAKSTTKIPDQFMKGIIKRAKLFQFDNHFFTRIL